MKGSVEHSDAFHNMDATTCIQAKITWNSNMLQPLFADLTCSPVSLYSLSGRSKWSCFTDDQDLSLHILVAFLSLEFRGHGNNTAYILCASNHSNAPDLGPLGVCLGKGGVLLAAAAAFSLSSSSLDFRLCMTASKLCPCQASATCAHRSIAVVFCGVLTVGSLS